MRTLVILPTYNESQNIGILIERLRRLKNAPEVLVVDDNSPDGTAQIVEKLCGNGVHLLKREGGKGGRGGAVRAGLEWSQTADRAYDVILEMDSDLSHKAEEVPQALQIIAPHISDRVPTMVIASRYKKGGRISGWPLRRRVFSRASNMWIRMLLRQNTSDFTNGFRACNSAAVKVLLASPQKNTGFIYLTEALCAIKAKGGRVLEFPTHWENRTQGQSSVGFKEISQSFVGSVKIFWQFRKSDL